MSIGADWYPRDPRKFIAGVQGMTAKQHAVYSIVIDLMYANGGQCPNDPKFIAGHFADIGPATARKSIEYLVESGLVFELENGRLSNKTVQKVAKTREETKEKRRISGEKGGKKSAELRLVSKENNDIARANGSTAVQPDKIRVDKSKNKQKDFGVFWSLWPNKVSKKSASVAWGKLSDDDKAVILSLPQAGFSAWKINSPTANPIHAATFLNGRRWEDSKSPMNGKPSQADMYRSLR